MHFLCFFLEVPPIIKEIRTTCKSDKAILSCEVVSGKPAPNIIWTKDGHVIQNSTKSTYIIESMKGKHAGTYHCTAANEAGKDSSSVSVRCKQVSSNNASRSDFNCITFLSTLFCSVLTSRFAQPSVQW